MAKRSVRRAQRQANQFHGVQETDNIRHLFDEPSWSPLHGSSADNTRKIKTARKSIAAPNNDQKYRKNIKAQNPAQQHMLDAIDNAPLVFATGAAGTGKTYIAVAKAVEALEAGRVKRIVLSRPAVEAGESLGYLPGGMEDKLSPYLRPLYDALCDRLSTKRLKALTAEGVIEIAPIAYMRGRTLNNAYVVIDEAQNCTYGQLKMLLTRLGWNSSMVVTGDPAQSDLLPGISGLEDVIKKLENIGKIGVVRFNRGDVVRHPLVAEMIDAL